MTGKSRQEQEQGQDTRPSRVNKDSNTLRHGVFGDMRPQPMIAVSNVQSSSLWYQKLLGCESAHGGAEYERLVYKGNLVMQLHHFEVEHHHGRIGDPDDKPYGNGVLLWFEIDDFDSAMERLKPLGPEVVMPKHRYPPSGDGGPNHWECWLRDPDGYMVVLASPDGSVVP